MNKNSVKKGITYLSTGAGFLPSTVAPENGWLEDEFPFGMAQFQGLLSRSVDLRFRPWCERKKVPKVLCKMVVQNGDLPMVQTVKHHLKQIQEYTSANGNKSHSHSIWVAGRGPPCRGSTFKNPWKTTDLWIIPGESPLKSLSKCHIQHGTSGFWNHPKGTGNYTQTLNVWHIYLHLAAKSIVTVGKFTIHGVELGYFPHKSTWKDLGRGIQIYKVGPGRCVNGVMDSLAEMFLVHDGKKSHQIQEVIPLLHPGRFTLPKTNSSPLKIGFSKRNLVFQPSFFRCREGTDGT